MAAALIWAVQRPPPAQEIARYHIELAPGQELGGSPWSRLAVSPDGARLVYVGDSERSTRLFVRSRDQLDAMALPGTDGAINPAFSPDGARIAFMDRVANGEIKVVSLTGGAPVPITDSAVGAPGISWGYDGFVYYDRLGAGPLMRVPETGGPAESIGHLDSARAELQHAWPDALPNGKGVLVTVSRGGPGAMGSESDEIAVLDVATGRHRSLVRGIFARYARSGHLVYVTADGALMGVPFDQDRMELTGDAVVLAQGVGVRFGGGAVDLAVSATGTLCYAAGGVGSGGTQEVVWVGRDGSATPVAPGWTGLVGDPALSPDGTRLAVSARHLESHIWIKELGQGPLSKLTTEGSDNVRPAWSPEGRFLAFVSSRGFNRDLYQQLADGSRPATLLLDVERPVDEVTFSRDGVWLVYRTGSFVGEGDLYARRTGSDSSIALVATAAYETAPTLSPDGRWLAYVSNESGRAEVYVRPFPNTGDGRWQISAEGGQEPVWAHSGQELFYRTTGSPVEQMVMEIKPGPTFVAGERKTLFPLSRYLTNSAHQQYAITPDDERFVMVRLSDPDRTDRLVVVEGFFEELKRLVPK